MTLLYEIEVETDEKPIHVLLPYAIYVLPNQRLADLQSTLVWCDNCGSYSAGEDLLSPETLRQSIDDAESGDWPDTFDFLYGDELAPRLKVLASWKRSLQWRKERISPAKCLDCGSVQIRTFDESDPATLFDPPTNRPIKLRCCLASTSIDNRLYLYSAEGDLLAETSRTDPNGDGYIDDASPYSVIRKTLDAAGRDA